MLQSNNSHMFEQQQKIIYLNDPQFPSNKLIINADDFGISQSRDKGIIQLIKLKRVSSISVLVNGINIQQSSKIIKDIVFNTTYKPQNIQLYLLQNLSIGLHFNLTEGKALYNTISCQLIDQTNSQMKGKNFVYNYFKNLQNNKLPLPVKQFIKTQFRSQINRFIQIFGIRPSHIDGHNHVHIIPQIAQLISPIMRQNGIYRVRLPLQNLSENSTKFNNSFNQIFIKYANISKQIFDRQKIVYPTHFIGLEQINELNVERISTKIKKIISQSKRSSSNIIQIMCHPGYADLLQGDDFNKSENRQIQLMNLKSQQFNQKVLKQNRVQLSNFNFLNPKFKKYPKRKILLYSKMNSGSGNWTTSLRLYQIFQSLGYSVYLRSIEQNVNTQHQTQSLRQFLIQFKITLIIGVNLTRAGRIIYFSTRSNNYISNRIPYILMVAGTDANIYFNNPEAPKTLKQPIQQCTLLISLSEGMLQITKNFIQQKIKMTKQSKQIILLSQSSNILSYEVKQQEQKQKVYFILKQNFNLDVKKDKYIIFPASFRQVKDIEFLLDQFNILMNKYQGLRVFIAGPILSQSYYQRCKPKLRKVQYLGSLEKQLYVQLLKNAILLVNSSISQGQCCSIQQAFQVGQISVVRNNTGNSQLVQNGVTGLLFNTRQQFVQMTQTIIKNQNNWVNQIKQNALKYHKQNFSIQAEAKNYKIIFDKILPQRPYIFAYPNVHSVCDVNLKLYNSIPSQILQKWIINTQNQKRIIDIGCGSGIFSFSVFYKIPCQYHNQIQLQQYDLNRSVLSNCYYNCLQESETSLSEAKSIKLKLSDMFSNIENPSNGNLYMANLPQSPFRYLNSRTDKNGGPESLKFNEALVRKFSQFNSKSMLIMLYSYMSYPKKFFGILEQLNLQVIWRSQKQYHHILSKSYDSMEQNLSQYIRQHINSGKAQVSIQKNENGQEMFIVPAQILIIQKKYNS